MLSFRVEHTLSHAVPLLPVASVGTRVTEETGTDKQAHWLARMETAAVLSHFPLSISVPSLLPLCILKAKMHSMVLARHRAPPCAELSLQHAADPICQPHPVPTWPHPSTFPRKDLYLWPYQEGGLLPTKASFLVCQA